MSLSTMLAEPVFLGNEAWRLAMLFVSLLAALTAGKVGRAILTRAAGPLGKAGRLTAAAALHAAARSLSFLAFALGLKAGFAFLRLPEKVQSITGATSSVALVAAIGWLVYQGVDVVDAWLRRLTGHKATKMDNMLVPLVRKSLRVTVVILTLLQIATLLSDKPVTSLLAGLGVGGLAVALAAQDTVKNFFGSLVIFADKPFEMGDRIVVDGFDGPVEEVGFRSTRIRTLEGHLVTFPNGELANKSIQNIGKRPYIRRLMNLTIPYDTPPEKVQRAMDIVKELLKDHEGLRPDFLPRVFFNEFASASLNLLVIYWYHPPDYWAYLAFGERLNLDILRRFNEEGIEFAFPTQTLYLAGDPKRPLCGERAARPEPS
ncbi:MAG: mechanosensitive ion channel family protein [Verrucomicrobia bacterium]|nr:mechanosensitive ion channel family protein [Verrucomicrobiota bacterium]